VRAHAAEHAAALARQQTSAPPQSAIPRENPRQQSRQ
jgi:hypothetical protein